MNHTIIFIDYYLQQIEICGESKPEAMKLTLSFMEGFKEEFTAAEYDRTRELIARITEI